MKGSEKRELIRTKAVKAVQNGESPEDVARIFETTRTAVYNWLARYRAGGWHALKEGKRSGRPKKLSAAAIRWLYNAITMHNPKQLQLPFCLWTLNVIRKLLKEEFDVELSKSAVSRLLRQLGLSPQRPIYKAYKQDPKEIQRYLSRTFPEVRAYAKRIGATIYFVDESSVRSDHHRGTTWGAVGRTPEVPDSGDRFTLKLISAVSPRGDMKFKFIDGRMNSDRFIDFIKTLQQDDGGPIVVISDHATYHKSGKVRKFAEENKDRIHFESLPKYAPELNPDEQVWNHAKSRLGKLFVASKEEMKSALLGIMRSIQRTKHLVRSFFKLDTTQYVIQ